MKSIEKQLSELPMANAKNVQNKLKELALNSIKKDQGEDLTKILAPYQQRFDKYMSEIVKSCSTSISVYHEATDEYFMISKERECINLTKLVNNYYRLPISEWLVRFSGYFFNTDIELTKDVIWGFNSAESTFNMVAMLFVEAIEIVSSNNNTKMDTYSYLANECANGNYEPLDKFQISPESNKKLNELHIMMADLNDILLKYPVDAYGSPFDLQVILDLGFEQEFKLFDAYKGYRKSFDAHPLEAMILLEKGMNEYFIDQLNKGIL